MQLITPNLLCCQNSAEWDTSDIIALCAVLVSIGAIVFAFISIRATKRLEVKYKEFEKLCLENVEKIFSDLDVIFIGANTNQAINKMTVTSVSTEFQIFIISLRSSVYSKIDILFLIERIERFTEPIYQYQNPSPSSFVGAYYTLKLDIYNYLYKHAMAKEI